jgi:hypothetical protein
MDDFLFNSHLLLQVFSKNLILKAIYINKFTFSTKSLTYLEYSLLNCLYLPLFIFAKSCYLLVSQKGGRPVRH